MPARIDVILGPDRGWHHEFAGSDVRIGRDPGCHIRLTDGNWPDGTVRIQIRNGGYQLTNLLPHPVYLDGRAVPPSGTRTFHHGALLQPTADTVLRFSPAPAAAELPDHGGVASSPPPPPPKSNRSRNLCALVLCLSAGWYWYSSRVPAFDPATAEPHKRTAAELLGRLSNPPLIVGEARRLNAALADAVYHEHGGQFRAAAAQYQIVCAVADHLLRETPPGAPDRAALGALRQFAGERLRATSGR